MPLKNSCGFTKMPCYKNACYQDALLPKCLLPKCPITETSYYRNIQLLKCPITEMSSYRNVLLPKCLLPKRPLAKCRHSCVCMGTDYFIYAHREGTTVEYVWEQSSSSIHIERGTTVVYVWEQSSSSIHIERTPQLCMYGNRVVHLYT